MKIIYTLILLLLAQIHYSQEDSIAKSYVYILRATGFEGSARQFKIFVDGNFSCKIKNNKYLILEVTPGKHSFAIQMDGQKLKENTERIEILTEAEKNYYLSSILEIGPLRSVTHFNELSESSGTFRITKLERVTCEE